MIIEKASGRNYYEIKGLTLGKIEGIRRALKLAQEQNKITIVEAETLMELENQFSSNEDLDPNNIFR